MVIIGGWRGGRRYRRRPYDPSYGAGYRPAGGSCLRDACLLESGCCLGEALAGNCLLTLGTVTPALVAALLHGQHPENSPARRARTHSRDRLIAAVRVYQSQISPRRRRPGTCRFTPTCSSYAVEALEHHGTAHGLRLAALRLLRCRPGGRRGPDPVPPWAPAFRSGPGTRAGS
jgi:putative membrane protein insertion efficiency factor